MHAPLTARKSESTRWDTVGLRSAGSSADTCVGGGGRMGRQAGGQAGGSSLFVWACCGGGQRGWLALPVSKTSVAFDGCPHCLPGPRNNVT